MCNKEGHEKRNYDVMETNLFQYQRPIDRKGIIVFTQRINIKKKKVSNNLIKTRTKKGKLVGIYTIKEKEISV
ncbi:hypothetical protein PIROE2DRAFT_1159 [Piromyces sp. E2]|nr:hypothetical protein PIROE2DRAFT_1159 [Piromyces sp. E2]|eukprot:OUM70630.1 hypothetical protein PIROE2DRAFT_1159 [Piromyces sp. E2]